MVRQTSPIRRSQIIEAARDLILSKGMESVTIEAIADAVGLSEGAIYRHFSSKRQILLQLIDEIESSLLKSVELAQSVEPTALRALECILETHLADVEGSRGVSFVVVAGAISFEGIGLSDRVGEMLTRYLEALKGLMRRGVAEGSLRPGLDVDAASFSFFGMIQSTATIWALNGYSWQLDDWRKRILEIYKTGVAVPQPQ